MTKHRDSRLGEQEFSVDRKHEWFQALYGRLEIRCYFVDGYFIQKCCGAFAVKFGISLIVNKKIEMLYVVAMEL